MGRACAKKFSSKNYSVVAVDIKAKSPDKNLRLVRADALKKGAIANLLAQHKPSVAVNCINLATLFSSQPVNQYETFIRFYIDLYKAIRDYRRPLHYIQVGTTGTGGLGFDIPFTHGQKKKDLPLFHKAAFAGISTAMLTLLSRSFDAKVLISEIKPGLAVFTDRIIEQTVGQSKLVAIDGGENGFFTYNELAILMCYMGFTTARAIAEKVASIIKGKTQTISPVAYDVVSGLNSVIVPEDTADRREKKRLLGKLLIRGGERRLIATGDLGPPELTRDLLLTYIAISFDHLTGEKLALLIKNDASVGDNLSYIKNRHPDLGKYLIRELNFANYSTVRRYCLGARFPWQAVRKLFDGRGD